MTKYVNLHFDTIYIFKKIRRQKMRQIQQASLLNSKPRFLRFSIRTLRPESRTTTAGLSSSTGCILRSKYLKRRVNGPRRAFASTRTQAWAVYMHVFRSQRDREKGAGSKREIGAGAEIPWCVCVRVCVCFVFVIFCSGYLDRSVEKKTFCKFSG